MSSHGKYREMTNNFDTMPKASQANVYEIRIQGHLGPEWADWFAGLAITLEGNGDTLLTGPLVDQSALHGVLKKVRDLGMPLLAVNLIKGANEETADGKQGGRVSMG